MLETIIAYAFIGIVSLVMAAAATAPLWKDKLDEVNGKTEE